MTGSGLRPETRQKPDAPAACPTPRRPGKAFPPVPALSGGRFVRETQRYLCSHCRKTWQLQFTYTASQPGTHQKIIDMAMNGVGCRATARIMGVGLNTILRHLKNSGRSR
ncbi:IS1-like element transposase [Enterobacter hormaechei]|uniref:IS1-like element transposase n=1 Tax=Enterobacter hormaechei TaxID=158836 RepID=UPI0034E091EC